MSATVHKALSLLNLFSESVPELGLSEVARAAGLDKATAYRLLNTLEARGFLEQHPQTKLYRLGPAVLHLARIREATFPVSAIVLPVLETLAAATGETAHLSLFAGGALAPIGVVESPKASRVSLSAAETLPLHATASGIAFLAFAPDELISKLPKGGFKAYTEHTITGRDAIARMVEVARRSGFATADQSYEDEVYGIAAPTFGPGEMANGAIAVATPSHRMTRELRALIIRAVMDAAIEVSRKLGNEPPPTYLKLCLRRAA